MVPNLPPPFKVEGAIIARDCGGIVARDCSGIETHGWSTAPLLLEIVAASKPMTGAQVCMSHEIYLLQVLPPPFKVDRAIVARDCGSIVARDCSGIETYSQCASLHVT